MDGKLRHHALNYVELTVTDLPAAKDFYQSAFGWKFVDYGEQYAGILMPGEETVESGGLLLADTPRPAGGPFVLLYSEDLDATAAAIEAAGGWIDQPAYPFPGGRRLHFTDPSGNELGVWASA